MPLRGGSFCFPQKRLSATGVPGSVQVPTVTQTARAPEARAHSRFSGAEAQAAEPDSPGSPRGRRFSLRRGLSCSAARTAGQKARGAS